MATYLFIGGSTGSGTETARKLIDLGHKVILLGRQPNETGTLPGVEFHTYDVNDPQTPFPMIPEVIDGLVYFPGTITLKPFKTLTQDDYLKDFKINVLGAATAIRACLDNLKRSGRASVVLFSTVAVQTGMAFHASVAVSKAGVEGLTRSLAAELAPIIRVNAIAPSLTDTPLAARLLAGEDKRKAAADRHPLKRFGTPADIADACVFLLSPSSSWITGQIIAVDGGMGSLK